MKRKLLSMLMVLIMVFVMTVGSTAVSWAGTDLASIESKIRSNLSSLQVSNTTSDGDIMFFVYDLLPKDMQGECQIDVYRQLTAATEDSAGVLKFHVAIDGELIPNDEDAPFEVTIPKVPKKEELSSPELDADWSLVCKALKKIKASNNVTEAQALNAAKKAVKNGSKCTMKSNFYKLDATCDADGRIQFTIQLELKGKYREAGYDEKIAALVTWPTKGISINRREWQILRETNKERFKQGKQLLTMVSALQTACDTRAKECSKYILEAHKRPDGSKFQTAIPKSFGRTNCGENLVQCTKPYEVTAQTAMVSWMNSDGHRTNILRSGWNYMGVGQYDNEGVQIFASRNTPIVKYTTSTGKTTFNSIGEMEKAYLICTDSAGRKSYMPLDTDYMKKVSGGYTINLYSRKTIKIKVKNNPNEFVFSDVSAKDKAAVKWVAMNKSIPALNTKKFYPQVAVNMGDMLYAIHRLNNYKRDGMKDVTNMFVGLDREAKYYASVFWAKKNNLIDYGMLNMEQAQTRGEGLYYVWKSIGSPKAKKQSTFTDFNKNVFYAQAVAWAQEKGIITDTGDHKFGGDDHILSRGELARYLYYAYKK